MKSSLSSIDLAALVAEIRPKIVNSWVNNIYSIGENLVILRFRKTTESPFELLIEPGKRIHITNYERKKPSTPNNKILSMRKHIRDLPVKNFYQRKIDRVLVLEIAFKDGFYKLVIELFSNGNIILIGPNDKIILAYSYRRMRDRDIHPGKEYLFPPSSEVNITNLDSITIQEKIGSSSGKIVAVLNELMDLGPIYSKEIIARTGIESTNIEDLQESDIQKITEEILSLQEIVNRKDYDPVKYLDEGEIVDITPIPLSRYEELEQEDVLSFNDELDEFFSNLEEEPDFVEDRSQASSKLTKQQKTLSNQEKHLEKLKNQEIEEKKKGDLLYSHFQSVDELLTTILQARRSDVTWEDITSKLSLAKEKEIPSALILEKLEPRTKTIVVNLLDQESGNIESIELDFTKTITDSANLFYEKAKKARRKIPGAKQAIERTKKMIEEAETTKETIVQEKEGRPLVVKRSKKWYEKFHWFKCQEHIVIGGTDAKVNERILKTYLDDNDLFFHADVHGAPYVVVKDGQNNLSEECITEIATFALSYSSLWKDKKLVGDVYHVLPDQVSLTAPSGQFLAKGSVMIYGEKNYSKNIEINHAVGVVLYESNAQVIGGPINSVESITNIFVQIKPGDVPKGKIVKEIKDKLLKQCDEEEKYKVDALTVNDLLPFIPGDSEIKI
jgi:predicted ribosome quality control (RQC) complex YloA/Tae2 family protein